MPSLSSTACETMFCLGCGVDLKERKGDHRLLCSSSTKKVLPALLETVKGVIGKDVKLDEEKINGSYMCTFASLAFVRWRNYRSWKSN